MRGFRINCLKWCIKSSKDIHDVASQFSTSSHGPKYEVKLLACAQVEDPIIANMKCLNRNEKECEKQPMGVKVDASCTSKISKSVPQAGGMRCCETVQTKDSVGRPSYHTSKVEKGWMPCGAHELDLLYTAVCFLAPLLVCSQLS